MAWPGCLAGKAGRLIWLDRRGRHNEQGPHSLSDLDDEVAEPWIADVSWLRGIWAVGRSPTTPRGPACMGCGRICSRSHHADGARGAGRGRIRVRRGTRTCRKGRRLIPFDGAALLPIHDLSSVGRAPQRLACWLTTRPVCLVEGHVGFGVIGLPVDTGRAAQCQNASG